MVAQAACPETSRLSRMLDGTLSPDDQTTLSLHLERCPQCQAEFESLSSQDGLLPEGKLPPEDRQESAMLGVMKKLTAEGPEKQDAGDPTHGEELYAPFLRPSDNPEHLGRLGPYEVLSLIGQGGMGMVFKARDPRLNRFVAIKVLAPQFAAHAVARKRFEREAKAAAAVSHDCLVTIYGVEEVDGCPYIIMEYVLGGSLAERIAHEGPLGLEDTLRIGEQIASGLAAAHARGLIHRDVKPANILLENGLQRVKIKITDFGLARVAGDLQVTHTGQLCGTPEYMSPEQARGGPIDHRSDLFSLGCVLYAMCAGRSPFHAPTPWEAIGGVCEGSPRPLREIAPETPEWLVEVIDRLLAKKADERFQSAGEVAEALRSHPSSPLPQSGRGEDTWTSLSETRKASLGETGPRGSRHRTARLWIIATMLIALGLLGVTEATGVTHLAATVIRLLRPEGILEIVVDDPNVKVTIDGDVIDIHGAGPHEVQLRLGKHEVQAVRDGKPVQEELVTIQRDKKQIVRISMTPPQAAKAEVPRGSAMELSAQGWQLFQKMRMVEAREKFVQAVKLAPNNANALNGLGWSSFNLGKWRDAEKAFQQALEIEQNLPGALNGLGQLYLGQRKYELAEKYLLKAAPQAPAAWFGLARLYLLQGKFAEAEKMGPKGRRCQRG